jgi:penicillin-binding protein 1C
LLKRTLITILFSSLLCFVVLATYISRPPDRGRLAEVAQVVRSHDGRIINLRLTKGGYWREKASLEQIDPKLIKVLIAYEDQRFWTHRGVDLRAVIRASYDFLRTGRISSGASTLTMQTVRLIDPSLAKHNVTTKLRQMLVAIRLEAHWSKEKILEAYFTLAPYGGNIEGINSATEAWLQKKPENLTLNEVALLVALPQSPEQRRPDRFPNAAYLAKRKVLNKVRDRLKFNNEMASEVRDELLPSRLLKPTSIAPHLADYIAKIGANVKTTPIIVEWQKQLQRILQSEVKKYPEPIQAAAIIVERQTGNVRAYVGSADYNSKGRKGANNYLNAIRSPGSTLKPIVYGKALQRNLISFNEFFDDQEFYRGGYKPTNFDNSYSGKVTLKDALLRSLNIPALSTLEKVGPIVFENEISKALGNVHQNDQNAGLSLAVGGYYLTAHQLIELYLASFDPGFTHKLAFEVLNYQRHETSDSSLLNQETADQLLHLLIQELPNGDRVAFKTGTSYARHDAWSLQIFLDHIVLVWVGTPDNEATETLTGRGAAFPISNEIGKALGFKPPELPKLKIQEDGQKFTRQNVCGTLIYFPENGAWIRSENAMFSVIGSSEADWYLNSKKIGSYKKQIKVSRPGVHKLTAKTNNCLQTSEIFVEFR